MNAKRTFIGLVASAGLTACTAVPQPRDPEITALRVDLLGLQDRIAKLEEKVEQSPPAVSCYFGDRRYSEGAILGGRICSFTTSDETGRRGSPRWEPVTRLPH